MSLRLSAIINGASSLRIPPAFPQRDIRQDQPMTDFQAARLNMVESQVRCNAVTDRRVIKAVSDIPRERFVPQSSQGYAYMDEDLKIADGGRDGVSRYLMEPRAFGKLVQLAEVDSTDLVLDIGCGTGYSAAVLAKLGSAVVALECDEDLAKRASTTLNDLGIDNAAVVTGPLEEGYADQAPYDVIFFNGSIEDVPSALFEQLKDNGRLVAVVGNETAGSAMVYTRAGDDVSGRNAFDALVQPLPGFRRAKAFVF